MHIPDSFARRLHDEHDGRLRIRWSPTSRAFQIEQKVGRAASPPYRIDEGDDSLVRARDGYAFVLEVTPGDRIVCTRCGAKLSVPHLKFAQVRCIRCKLLGEDSRYMVGYFPLGEALLQHLRRIRPEQDPYQRTTKAIDARNRALLAARERELSRTNEAIAKDTWGYVTERQQIGYGSKPQHSDKGLPAHD